MAETWGQTPEDLARILGSSRFRSRFHLTAPDREYIARRGWAVIEKQTRGLLAVRLAVAHPVNDGRQTPWRGHVVFIAQHATGCCCRGCLAKIHRIEAGKELTPEQLDYAVNVIVRWLKKEAGEIKNPAEMPEQLELF